MGNLSIRSEECTKPVTILPSIVDIPFDMVVFSRSHSLGIDSVDVFTKYIKDLMLSPKSYQKNETVLSIHGHIRPVLYCSKTNSTELSLRLVGNHQLDSNLLRVWNLRPESEIC